MSRAGVVVVAGPSGAGKSRLAERLALPVLRLDDFYKDGGDPTLPRIASGANAGSVDWDHPDSWLCQEALTTVRELCQTGIADVPLYDIARDGRHGSERLDLAGAELFVAEGIFAQEIVATCRQEGLLAEAYCIRQHPFITFWRRLVRDLREHRKPPLFLVRRGLALLHDQRRVVTHAEELGCRPMSAHRAVRDVAGLRTGATR